MKKQYLEPKMNLLPMDACDVIATSVEHDDIMDYVSVWNTTTAD